MGHLIVPPVLLGEGEGLADKAPDALAQSVVPALHVRGLPALLADTAVSLLREHRRVGLPEVAEAVALAVGLRHSRPKSPAGLLAVVAVDEGHDLAGPATHHRPEPALVSAQQHERPDLVELKDILSLGREQGFLHVGQAQEFFFNHCVIVLRVIPKVRLSPRSEERS